MSIQTINIHEVVQEKYSAIAETFVPDTSASCCDDSCGCANDDTDQLFTNLYKTDTSWLPADVTGLSLGCGDPIALAELQKGQTVLDLGSGGGIDCFMAAKQVGAEGYVIGVDMTPSMLEKANRNKEKVGLDNVEFRLGKIEELPVEDQTIDVIISNCVVNLSPDKTAVLRSAFRVLKPNGKIAISDIVTLGKFSEADRANMAQWTGCITGAEEIADIVTIIKQAGFETISVRDKNNPDIELADVAKSTGEPKVISARITAYKPA